MKLKELAKDRPVFADLLKRLEHATEQYVVNGNFAQRDQQLYRQYEISGYIWGLYESGIITDSEKDELINDLFELQEICL